MRIVSLLPSATEIVCAIGREHELVGISHSCNYPPSIANRPVVTRTSVPLDASSRDIDAYVRRYLGDHAALYQLDLRELELARPDVIVSQRLCDVCAVSTDEVLDALQSLSSKPTLVDLEPAVLGDVFDDILRVGQATKSDPGAQAVVAGLRSRIDAVRDTSALIDAGERPRVAMLEWLDPPFSSGHWNPELIELAGGIDCLGPKGRPSATVSWEDVIAAQPDVLVIGCCGFDTERATRDIALLANHGPWQRLLHCVGKRVLVTDGDAYFSRPGPRLVDGLEALAHALHPAWHPPPRTDARVVPVSVGGATQS